MIAANAPIAVLSSTRVGSQGFDLWQARRGSTTTMFDPPSREAFAAINNGGNQFDASLSADALRVIYSSSVGVGGQQLFIASCGSISDDFGPPVLVPGSGTFTVEADPELSPDELVLVYAATSPLQLDVSVRATTGAPFGTPSPLTVNAGGYDGDPAFSADGCELFFVSDRGGDRDLYRTVIVL